MSQGNSSLCQTEQTSCVACCMNSYLSIPKEDLIAILDRRAGMLQESEGPLDYQSRVSREEDVPFCKFIGYIDQEHSSVGCIIHPENTGSQEDLRQHEQVRRGMCSGVSCKTNDLFTGSDEQKRSEMIEFVSGMDWYALSNFIRRGNSGE